MKRLLVIPILFPVLAFGQWSPCWTNGNQFHWYNAGNEALSAAVERLTVTDGPTAWTNYMTTNLWKSYFSQASKCRVAKNMLGAAVDNFGLHSGGGAWIPRQDDYSEVLVASNGSWWIDGELTKSGLLANVGAPADWWTNTPQFNLQTHSNGWRFFRQIVTNVSVGAVPFEIFSAYSTADILQWSGTSTNSIDEALSNAVASTASVSGSGGWNPGAATYWNVASGLWTVNLYKEYDEIYWSPGQSYSLYPEEFGFFGKVYFRAGNFSGGGTFESFGDNVDTNMHLTLTWTNAIGGDSPYLQFYAASSNVPPQTLSTNGAIIGWSVDTFLGDELTVYDFLRDGITNGFRYK